MQNTVAPIIKSEKITVLCRLVELQSEPNGYVNYVFSLCDEKDSELYGMNYIICTKYPNWNSGRIELGEEGYLYCEEIIGGYTQWVDQSKLTNYNYDHIHFIKFIPKKERYNNLTI